MHPSKCNCLECFVPTLARDTSALKLRHTEMLTVMLSKLHLERYYTEDVTRELMLKVRYLNSFPKLLVYSVDKVLKNNDRYIPIRTLCYYANVSVRSYNRFIKLNADIRMERPRPLSPISYMKFVTIQTSLSFRDEKKLLKMYTRLVYTTCHGTHPVAIVCGLLHVHFSYKIRDLALLGHVSPQTINKCLRECRGTYI